ncbi:MAG: capsular polysaccharide synthesis protein [Selenomonadaceae bacterium]|nr:capsular polysaccharide synthesis protein [Selenomonadaceae bacterium]
MPPPKEVLNIPNDLDAFNYVQDRYSKFLSELPVYEREEIGTPKFFWWCWLQGLENAPPLCKMCLKSLRRNYSDYQINVVTLKNMGDYVSFPEHIIKKFSAGKISPTHFSDLLRLELLINYGGVWADSCVLATGREKDYLQEPLFIFQSTWRNAPAHLGSSWFIVSEKGNPILKTTRDLLYKYWQDHDALGNGGFYFLIHCMFHLAADKYPDLWAKVPVFSNIPPHMLQMEFFNPYNPDRFEQIKRMSNFHKLSWKYPPAQLAPEKTAGTNYDYLMKFFA